jgi:hypothetical protein
VAWVRKCLAEFAAIKPGMTRAQIEKLVRWDGGLQTVSPMRYVLPECRYFKIDVTYSYKTNPADEGRAIWSPDDKAVEVSKPYIEEPILD